MTSPEYDVLGLGAVAVDDLLYVDEFPRPDGKTQVQAKARAGGGLAGTALVAAARLGARAAYCGVLDDDELSAYTLAELRREGVNCDPVQRRAGARPYHSVIIVSRTTPERCILFSNADVVVPTEADLPASLIAASRVLFVDHTVASAAIRAAAVARPLGIPIVGDIEGSDFREREAFLGSVDHLILNQEIAEQLTGVADAAGSAAALLRPGYAAVVVTDGAAGSWYATPSEAPTHVPALQVNVADTTGCGDVFHGAYAACLAWGGDVRAAVDVATVAAGLKARSSGGRAGIPSRAEVERYLPLRR
jgi:sulfofructose kinase